MFAAGSQNLEQTQGNKRREWRLRDCKIGRGSQDFHDGKTKKSHELGGCLVACFVVGLGTMQGERKEGCQTWQMGRVRLASGQREFGPTQIGPTRTQPKFSSGHERMTQTRPEFLNFKIY